MSGYPKAWDDYDQSIKEAIKGICICFFIFRQKQSSPEHMPRRESVAKAEALTNGKYGPPYATLDRNFGISSPESSDSDDDKEDNETDNLDRSNRQRRRPKRYTEREFVEAVSDNETDFDSDDDIVGEAVYDEEYLKKRKQKRMSSSGSEGDDEEYQWDEYNVEDDEEEDDDDDDSLSISEDSDKPLKVKQLRGRTRRETKLRSVGEIQSGLRRSKRATKNRINYRQCEASESETELIKSEKSNSSADHSDPSENGEYMMESEDSDGSDNEEQEKKVDEPVPYPAVEENEQNQPPEKLSSPGQEEVESSTGKRRFLDLNELAPSTGFDDGPNTIMKDEDNDY
ncbi:DDT domain-containing protein DDR4 [Glycine max]|nr:DDT domain-containing protein DDR4 [Glycine max]